VTVMKKLRQTVTVPNGISKSGVSEMA
jgi:hypothetical protein